MKTSSESGTSPTGMGTPGWAGVRTLRTVTWGFYTSGPAVLGEECGKSIQKSLGKPPLVPSQNCRPSPTSPV